MAQIVIFAFDSAEASQIRRIRSLRSLGHAVSSVSFRRANMNAAFTPDWPDTSLGTIDNGRFVARLLRLGRAALRLAFRPALLREADVIIARNLDLLALAWWARLLHRDRSLPLVYECLDIHGLMTSQGRVGRIMRAAERFLLARCDLLIVSSPGFIDHYFAPIQGYEGPVSLLENKLWFEGAPLPRPATAKSPRPPLVVGCVGSIRCPDSLRLLCGAADALPDSIRIAFHGNIHRHVLPDFDAQIAARPNMLHHGPYQYPDDLAAVYGACDIVWAQDLWQRGENSDWLLPNRIYEASWFGCPSIAVADTETGRRIVADGLGLAIGEPSISALVEALAGLTPERISALSAGILAQPESAFRLMPEALAAALAPVLERGGDPVVAGKASASANPAKGR